MAAPMRKPEPRNEVCDLLRQLLEATATLNKCYDEINHTRVELKEIKKKPALKANVADSKKNAEKRLHLAQVEVDRIKGRLDLFKNDFPGDMQQLFAQLDKEPSLAARKLLDRLS